MYKIEIRHDRKALAEAVQELVRALPAREQMVISMLFGIDDGEHTVEEISSLLGLTTQRIYQIKESAFQRLVKKSGMKAIQEQMVGYV